MPLHSDTYILLLCFLSEPLIYNIGVVCFVLYNIPWCAFGSIVYRVFKYPPKCFVVIHITGGSIED